MVSRILIVCVGNICRSPMGLGVFEHALRPFKHDGIEVRSAGLHALVGQPADPTAQYLMLRMGVDLGEHRACQLNGELIRWADLILVMEKSHKKYLHAINSISRGKVYRLGEWSDINVPDPYRQDCKMFEYSLRLIRQGVSEWIPRLVERGNKKISSESGF